MRSLAVLGFITAPVEAAPRFEVNVERSLGFADAQVCRIVKTVLNSQCTRTKCTLDLSRADSRLKPVPWRKLLPEESTAAANSILKAKTANSSADEIARLTRETSKALANGDLVLLHAHLLRPHERLGISGARSCAIEDVVKQVRVFPKSKGETQAFGMAPVNDHRTNGLAEVYSMMRDFRSVQRCPAESDGSFHWLATNWQLDFQWEQELFALEAEEELTDGPSRRWTQVVNLRGLSGLECVFDRVITKRRS